MISIYKCELARRGLDSKKHQKSLLGVSSDVAGEKCLRLASLANEQIFISSCSSVPITVAEKMNFFSSRGAKTFRPKKNIPEGFHQYELMKHAEATLGSGNLRQAVSLPDGEDINEWVAVNTVDFFNQINMLYGTITEFCTTDKCPVMSAGPKYEYHWADGQTVKKPIKCSAPKYIDYLMTWVQDQLDDETIFPSKIGVPFPKNFMTIAKTILKRLFRVYAHIYHQHFKEIVILAEEAHLNTSFKHFIYFVQEFNLIDRKELAPLQELIDRFSNK
ncbi:MOB kinase activator 1A [Strongylocentrotus purpuratus]|uniref:MOB kinase activator-like 1 n=1 Tax=Strongylocentrotus purpuratus TaxID=7668 RepID=A0A7M7RHE1_STRPU|nr:MOB kinase activator 1A [Strongylocentrotus purpuratus]